MFLSKTQNGRYYIYYKKSDGKMTRISTKTKKKSEAVKFLSEFEKQIKLRSLTETIPMSLSKFKLEYLKYSEANHSPKTTRYLKSLFKKFIEFCGDIQLSNITELIAKDYIQSRTKISVYTAQKHLAHLRKAFNYGLNYGYVISNPFRNIENFRLPEKQPLFIDQDSFKKLLNVIDDKDFQDLVIFAVNTGLRQMEILTMEWSQIDFKERLIMLNNRNHITKSKKIRTVPLNLKALQILADREIKKKNEIVFTKNGESFKADFVSKKFKKYVIKAKLNPAFKFHSCRHSFASWLVQKGVPILSVSKLLGHQDLKTTQIYAHVTVDTLAEAVNSLD